MYTVNPRPHRYLGVFTDNGAYYDAGAWDNRFPSTPPKYTDANQVLSALAAEYSRADVPVYGTFRLNFHRFDWFELDLRGHTQPWGAAFSCLRLK